MVSQVIEHSEQRRSQPLHQPSPFSLREMPNIIFYRKLDGFMSFGSGKSSLIAVIVLAISSFLISTAAQVQSSAAKNDQNYVQFETPDLELKLSRSSQTAVGLAPTGA